MNELQLNMYYFLVAQRNTDAQAIKALFDTIHLYGTEQ